MKRLIDILVENLPSWPAHVDQLWILDDGRPYPSNIIFGKTGGHSVEFSGGWDIPCDYKTARVTRAEWQAAVDALNAPKVVEWDGVSLPSPGDSLEYKTTDAGEYWCKAIVKFVGTHFLLVGYQHPDLGLSEAGINHAMRDGNFSGLLRKALTAKQVAAEENRASGIEEIHKVLLARTGISSKTVVAEFYDEHCKQVAK